MSVERKRQRKRKGKGRKWWGYMRLQPLKEKISSSVKKDMEMTVVPQ